jgi:hypothetical protein
VKYIGLDTSLTSSGLAVIWSPTEIVVTRHRSKKLQDGWGDLHRRIKAITGSVLDAAGVIMRGDIVALEDPIYGAIGNSGHQSSGLWWSLYSEFRARGATVVGVNSSHRKMYATGAGSGAKASKDAVLAAAIKRYPEQNLTGNDEADAMIIAALVARWAGRPIESTPLPAVNLRLFDKLGPWPI